MSGPKPTPELFCTEMARLFQFHKMYPSGNMQVNAALHRTADVLADLGVPVRFSRIGQDLFLEESVLANPSRQVVKLFDAFAENRWESLKFSPQMGADGLFKVLERISSPEVGPFRTLGFAAGSISTEEGGDGLDSQAEKGVGYLGLFPLVQELMEDVASGKRGTWLRAKDTVKTLTEYMLSGTDLFGPVSELKDYDEYTFTHAINVSLISTTMARSLQVSDKIVDEIAMGALCHDLGKKTIPHDILNKPTKLTPEEKIAMDLHPVEGARMILESHGECPHLVPIIAFQHHLKPNGEGYPVLPVQQIPHPASLLVSVADTYDALRTVRPYQSTPITLPTSLSIMLDLAERGVHHKLFVSVLARNIGVLTPGRRVIITGSRPATILSEGENDALAPLVETDDMEIIDLALPGSPNIEKVLD